MKEKKKKKKKEMERTMKTTKNHSHTGKKKKKKNIRASERPPKWSCSPPPSFELKFNSIQSDIFLKYIF
jgi:hypothetical protein